MNKDTQRAWVNEALDEVLEALASRKSIRSILVFKGARVLHRRLESTPPPWRGLREKNIGRF
jgi:hypothetical protein